MFMPETKQKPLEELDYVFTVPTTVDVKFQPPKMLPWWTGKYMFRRKNTVEPQLYHLEGQEQSS